ncbi:hypothetical protein EIP91_011181 [Steccherinum ochraceum]|uniref:Uncharacterized protein n=1 Tax=Steccherinum ochraceum TaxID=92696 RepID=A0A4R0RMC8_9APHY|nr:hypothetical protein EIP91_011181 [Steccherinum ochraceum]
MHKKALLRIEFTFHPHRTEPNKVKGRFRRRVAKRADVQDGVFPVPSSGEDANAIFFYDPNAKIPDVSKEHARQIKRDNSVEYEEMARKVAHDSYRKDQTKMKEELAKEKAQFDSSMRRIQAVEHEEHRLKASRNEEKKRESEREKKIEEEREADRQEMKNLRIEREADRQEIKNLRKELKNFRKEAQRNDQKVEELQKGVSYLTELATYVPIRVMIDEINAVLAHKMSLSYPAIRIVEDLRDRCGYLHPDSEKYRQDVEKLIPWETTHGEDFKRKVIATLFDTIPDTARALGNFYAHNSPPFDVASAVSHYNQSDKPQVNFLHRLYEAGWKRGSL